MEDTKRRIIAGYAIFTLLFISGVFVFMLLRIDALSWEHKVRIEEVIGRFRINVVDRFSKAGSFASEQVADLFPSLLSDNPDLLVIAVSSPKYGILQSRYRSKNYFPPAQYRNQAGPVEFKKPLGTAELSPVAVTLIYNNVSIDARIDALYTVFSNDDATVLLQELLLILLGFVVLTFIMIIIVSAVSSRDAALSGRDRIAATALARRRPGSAVDAREYPGRRTPSSERHVYAHRPDSSRTAESFIEELPELDADSQPSDSEPASEPEPRFGYDSDSAPEPHCDREPELEYEAEAAAGLEWSEEERKARRLERYDERTGLVRKEFFRERLAMEIERAASFREDAALLLVAVSAARSGADPWGGEFTDALRRSFTDADLSFEYEPGTAAVIAPGMSIDAAIRSAKILYQSLLAIGVRACLGITARGGRQIAPESFVEEAAQALAQAKTGGQSPIIAFRIGG
ncbi:MAG: GGDEF domain-containing protein [Spirochaetales bacterium]|nr:GGDEF domain-containing protein [Spirochaetales bacterium]